MTFSQSQKNSGANTPAAPASRAYDTYRIFDTVISSQVPLPELPICESGDPRVTFRLVDAGQLDLAGFACCHEWRTAEGQLICRSARRGAEYLLSLPQRACFHIAPGGVISGSPAPGVNQGPLRQLLLNQVLPRFLAHTGEFLLHASAVTLTNGKTVAFLGDSGKGKSTLASYCHQHGAQIIDDDSILVRAGQRRIGITGGVPTLRLYPDSLGALGMDPAGFASCADYSDKQQMWLARGRDFPQQPRNLDALFLLEGPGEALAGAEVRIEPAGGQVAMMALLRSAFQLDPSAPHTMTRNFSHAARFLTEDGELTVSHLYYPRDHARLPQVLQALLGYP